MEGDQAYLTIFLGAPSILPPIPSSAGLPRNNAELISGQAIGRC